MSLNPTKDYRIAAAGKSAGTIEAYTANASDNAFMNSARINSDDVGHDLMPT